ncbi:hypothetical protein GPECTOR_65g164 [Gonium pectorale]|uniref:Cyclic nucleotide-binding domain-containing protein n=1 Tax=Gonium pectorale TaxID=33097 RepID=A0A150G3T8_GONPE|nr:hypothetical protein GPECTOR_65g164 [Gonium pectorale]|eukprot:KXZ44546.1 hypothetical protein GPECTOR_65g164 [Gonium pectorale]
MASTDSPELPSAAAGSTGGSTAGSASTSGSPRGAAAHQPRRPSGGRDRLQSLRRRVLRGPSEEDDGAAGGQVPASSGARGNTARQPSADVAVPSGPGRDGAEGADTGMPEWPVATLKLPAAAVDDACSGGNHGVGDARVGGGGEGGSSRGRWSWWPWGRRAPRRAYGSGYFRPVATGAVRSGAWVVDGSDPRVNRRERLRLVLTMDPWDVADKYLPLFLPSTGRTGWDILLLVLLLYTAVVVPLEAGFQSAVHSGVDASHAAVLALFWVDMIVQFRTAFVSTSGELVRDSRVIASHYARTWFPLDLVSSFPWAELLKLLLSKHDSRAGMLASLARLPRLLRLIKLFRVLDRSRHANMLRMVRLMALLMLVSHWAACIWHGLSEWVDEFPWLFSDLLVSSSLFQQYSVSIYYSYVLVVGSDNPQPPPQNNLERCFMIVALVLGSIMSALVISNMAMLVANYNSLSSRYAGKAALAADALRYIGAPDAQRSRVAEYYDFLTQHEHPGPEADSFLSELPRGLLEDIKWALYSRHLGQLPLFAGCDESFMAALQARLTLAPFTGGELIFSENDVGREMFIVRRGAVLLRGPTGDLADVLTEGQAFGELALLPDLAARRRVSTAIAGRTTDLIRLSARDLAAVCRDHPDSGAMVQDRLQAQLQLQLLGGAPLEWWYEDMYGMDEGISKAIGAASLPSPLPSPPALANAAATEAAEPAAAAAPQQEGEAWELQGQASGRRGLWRLATLVGFPSGVALANMPSNTGYAQPGGGGLDRPDGGEAPPLRTTGSAPLRVGAGAGLGAGEAQAEAQPAFAGVVARVMRRYFSGGRGGGAAPDSAAAAAVGRGGVTARQRRASASFDAGAPGGPSASTQPASTGGGVGGRALRRVDTLSTAPAWLIARVSRDSGLQSVRRAQPAEARPPAPPEDPVLAALHTLASALGVGPQGMGAAWAPAGAMRGGAGAGASGMPGAATPGPELKASHAPQLLLLADAVVRRFGADRVPAVREALAARLRRVESGLGAVLGSAADSLARLEAAVSELDESAAAAKRRLAAIEREAAEAAGDGVLAPRLLGLLDSEHGLSTAMESLAAAAAASSTAAGGSGSDGRKSWAALLAAALLSQSNAGHDRPPLPDGVAGERPAAAASGGGASGDGGGWRPAAGCAPRVPPGPAAPSRLGSPRRRASGLLRLRSQTSHCSRRTSTLSDASDAELVPAQGGHGPAGEAPGARPGGAAGAAERPPLGRSSFSTSGRRASVGPDAGPEARDSTCGHGAPTIARRQSLDMAGIQALLRRRSDRTLQRTGSGGIASSGGGGGSPLGSGVLADGAGGGGVAGGSAGAGSTAALRRRSQDARRAMAAELGGAAAAAECAAAEATRGSMIGASPLGLTAGADISASFDSQAGHDATSLTTALSSVLSAATCTTAGGGGAGAGPVLPAGGSAANAVSALQQPSVTGVGLAAGGGAGPHRLPGLAPAARPAAAAASRAALLDDGIVGDAIGVGAAGAGKPQRTCGFSAAQGV